MKSKIVKGRRLIRAAMETLESRQLMSASLLKDINTTYVEPSYPPAMTTISSTEAVFTGATDDYQNVELFKTDGTAAGTSLLSDVVPGYQGSNPSHYVSFGSGAYFTALIPQGTGTTEQLYHTDGTTAGTVPVTGFPNAFFNQTVAMGNTLYLVSSNVTGSFNGTATTYSEAIYAVNGTTATLYGSVPLAIGGSIVGFVTDGTHLYVATGAAATTAGQSAYLGGVYYSDSTSATGFTAATGNPILFGGYAPSFVGTPDGAYYVDNTGDLELVTPAGATQVGIAGVGVFTGTVSAVAIGRSVLIENNAFYLYTPGGSGPGFVPTESYNGVTIVQNNLDQVQSLFSAGGDAYFYGTLNNVPKLFRIDSTGTVTSVFNWTLSTFPETVTPSAATGGVFVTDSNGNIYYGDPAVTSSSSPVFLYGTSLSSPVVVSFGSGALFETSITGQGMTLFKSDGTAAGTGIVTDIDPATGSSNPGNFTTVGNLTYFTAVTSQNILTPYVTDGTASGTVALVGNLVNAGLSSNTPFVAVGSAVYFTTGAGNLWVSDGAATGTSIVTGSYSNAIDPTFYNGSLYFIAGASGQTKSLWKATGGVATLVQTLSSNDSGVQIIAAVNGLLILKDSSNLYSTEGIGDPVLPLVTGGASVFQFTAIGNELYFGATTSSGPGISIWRTDGHPGDTGIFHATNSETGFSAGFAELNGLVYTGLPDGSKSALYSIDPNGNATLINPTTATGDGWNPSVPVAFNGALYYLASSNAASASTVSVIYDQLWKVTGTTASLVYQFPAAPGGVHSLTVVGDELYMISPNQTFSGTTQGQIVDVLYASDGTTAGTEIVSPATRNVSAGVTGYSIGALANGRAIAAFEDGVYGYEPWTFAPDVTAPATGTVSGFVFNDLTDNGATSDDRPLAGITVYADINNNGQYDPGEPAAITGVNGGYTLTVPVGTVTIGQVLGSRQSSVGNASMQTATVTAGNVSNIAFLDYTPPRISGYVTIPTGGSYSNYKVFIDIDHDGKANNSDPVFTLGANGFFDIEAGVPANVPEALAPGTYTLGVEDSTGYTNTANFVTVSVVSGSDVSVTLVAGAPQGTPTPFPGTPIGTPGSYQNDGNTIANAFDGNLATFFDAPTATGNWVGLDLGTPQVVTEVKFASRSGYASRMNGGIFQASNSANFSTGVVNLYTIAANANPSSAALTAVTFANTAAYRYYRYLSPANSYGNISELQFLGVGAPPVVTTTPLTGATIGTAGSYQNDGNTIAKATDGNLTTFFDGSTANSNWVGMDLGPTGGVVTQIKYASRSGFASRMNGGIFQASNTADFSSGVVSLYTIPAGANPSSTVLTTVSISNTTAYRYYRYLSPSGSYGNVAEVQFFGTAGGLTALTQRTGTTIGTAGSYQNDGNTIANATDGNLATFVDGATANGNWVGLDLGSAESISQISYAPRSGWAGRMVGGMFQISTTADFSSGVTTIYTITATPVVGSLTTVTLSSPVTARYVRYLSPAGSYGNIAEMQFFG